ncbi:MAG TPA: glycosyltransferase family 39 protein [Thermoanaerobaculia bacterium]|nr:glycosyltransferase family 39 protein [Thermoanaerobaculia bacterium]
MKLARAAALAVYTFVLLSIQLRVVDNLTTDGVAYLRQAQYWAEWQTHLMVSAYWSPGMSWLIALFMRAGAVDLVALRLVMTLNGVVFVIGCARLLAVMQLPRALETAALILCAVPSLIWASSFISPDLLVAGLVYCAIAFLITALEQQDRKRAALAGLFFGLAFLAKAVALPLGIAVTAGYIFVTWRRTAAPLASLVRIGILTVVATIAVAAPWIAAVSMKVNRLTMSTSGAINHAILSPDNNWRDRRRPHRLHPVIQTFHKPERGRITSWEDPSNAQYHYWSPFASRRNFARQLETSADNLSWAAKYLALFDWAYVTPVVVLLAAASVFRRGGGATMRVLQIAGIMCGALIAAYLPVYGRDFRYYAPLFPFAVGAAAACYLWLANREVMRRHPLAQIGLTLALAVAYVPPLVPYLEATTRAPVSEASITADWVARALWETGHTGPIAGSGYLQNGGDTGLYIAYLLGQPWYGDERHPSFARLEQLKPRLVIAPKFSPFAQALARDPRFVDLDPILLPRRNGRTLRIKVFEMR